MIMTETMTNAQPPVHTVADRIIAQADSGRFPGPHWLLKKMQRGDFELGGLHFHFERRATEAGQCLDCSALIGHLPFTAQNAEGRQAVREIIFASSHLPHARFRLDPQNRIYLGAALPLPQEVEEEDLMLALIALYQQTHPLMALVAENLTPRQSQIK
jgi:hypothetical protein